MTTTVLIVDDNALNRELLLRVLSDHGYRVVTAGDGAEGLLKAKEHRPQLIISDILMPSMDGYEFVRRLRADPGLAPTPVIFCTANYHEREAVALAARCQVQRVLVKPCTRDKLLAATAEVLAASERPAGPPDVGFDAEHLRLLTDKLAHTADELQAANDRLRALIDVSVQLSSEREPQALLDRVCNAARDLIAARYCVLAVGERMDAGQVLGAISGLESSAAAAAVQVEAGLLGSLLKEPRAIRLAHPEADLAELGLPACCPPPANLLAVPIASLERPYGWICVADKLGSGEFSTEDQRLLTLLGAKVGRIYENQSLYREVRDSAARLLVEAGERERAVMELLASEERFRQLAENIEDVFFLFTPEPTRILYVSPVYERIWGRSCAELIEEPRSWTRSVHPEDLERVLQERLRTVGALPAPGQMEFRIVDATGTVRWIQSRLFAVCDAGGAVTRIAGVATDVTERRQAEEKIRHLNRLHGMLSGINSLMVRAVDRSELLKEACRLATHAGLYGATWCGLIGTDGQLQTMATGGEFARMLPQFRPDLSEGASSGDAVVAAINSLKAVVCEDLEAGLGADPFRSALLAGGYRAGVALPLVIEGRAIGCLAFATRASGFFDAVEMALLSQFAADLGFALDHIAKSERLAYLAYFDALTGLPNRALFLERITRLGKLAPGKGAKFAVVVADPERVAVLNDTLGRLAGDQLLREMAQRLARCVGSADLVARTAADQFAALVTGVHATADASRIVDELWRKWLGKPFVAGEHAARITARAGVAMFPADGSDAETLLRNAETAVNTAKRTGRPFAAYTPRLAAELAERTALERNLRQALERGEFVLHYQPKVDLQSRRVTGMEALIRWQSPELGLVPPGRFIPVIEQSGMIVEVGAWVLHQATLDRARWLEGKLAAPRVAVNVSTVQLRRDDFVPSLSHILRLGGNDPGLDIEVTESLMMQDIEDNLAKLAAIRGLGVQICLDDFGTGYSSLAYLARLPVNTLKIDRSFVAAMLDDPSAMTLVSTIISLARALKMHSVAEGVESEEQAKILRLLQCDYMQGYLVSKPVPFDEMTAFLSRARPQPASAAAAH